MNNLSQPEEVRQALEFIRARAGIQPALGIVLGSGPGAVADVLQNATAFDYQDIPHFPAPSVEGHGGRLVIGELQGAMVAVLQGRVHYYEGYEMPQVVFSARVLCMLGIHTLLLTNAAGAVNPRFQVGDLMGIEDHLNLLPQHPLRGPNFQEYGPRFLDLSEAYDEYCLEALQDAAEKAGITMHTGVYAALSGPSYETPAEVRMLRTLGADAVGMSTVPECIIARQMGVRVAGVSCITNLAAGLSPHHLSHQEVIDASHKNAAQTVRLLENVAPQLAATPKSRR